MSFYNGILNYDDIHGSGQIGPRGLPGIGFNLDPNNDYDMQNKKLVSVKNGVNGSDAVTKSQLDTKTSLLDGARTHGYIVNNKAVIYSQSGAVHAKSFYLQDQNEDEVRILTDNQDFDDVHLFVPNLKNFDGFGGRKRSEIMVTSVDQIISGNNFFENIKAPNPTEDGDVANKNYVDFEITKQNVLIDNEFVKISGSLMTGDLILPHYDYPVQGNTNKAISYETQREIFISRKETFPMETSLDMNNNVIENIAEATRDHHALRKSQLDNALVMVNNDLSDKADKSYVDSKIENIQKIDTKDFIKRDGSVPFSANLNMGGNKIKNVGTALPHENDAAVNVSFFNTELNSSNSNLYTQVTNAYKEYLDKTLEESHITSSHTKNEFKYLDDPNDTSSEYNIVINDFTDFQESPHRNKKAFQVSLQKDNSGNNYRSRMGFNLYPLPLGTYTIIFEYFPPEMTNIQLSCQAATAYVHKQVQKDFTEYSKLLVQINNNSKITPDYIYFTIHGTAVVSNPEGYIIVYGIKDWSDSVKSDVYDSEYYVQMFEYKNDTMYMNTDIELNTIKSRMCQGPN